MDKKTKTQQNTATATRLLMRFRGSLYAYIFACLRNHADAEDVFQDVSVAVIESTDRCPDEDGFLPWCREIARRRVLAHLRKSSRTGQADPQLIAALTSAAENVEQNLWGRRAALFDCLEELPHRQRKLIAARYDAPAGGAADLATAFGLSLQAFYSKVKRIKQILRDCVERRLAGEQLS